jgi:type II secretory pathway component GspD/PulD (secretin)
MPACPQLPTADSGPGLRPWRGMLAWALAWMCLCGCQVLGSGEPSPRERSAEINATWERILLGADTLTPVADFDEASYFDELERLYAQAPIAEAKEADPVADTAPLEPRAIDPFQAFGERIWVDVDTGFVTKPYTFPSGLGQRAMTLLSLYGDFDIPAEGGVVVNGAGLKPIGEQGLGEAVLDLRLDFDGEPYSAPSGETLQSSTFVPLSDWLFVRAQPEVLLKAERFIELFSARVRMVEIEARIIEVSTSDSFDYGIRPIDSSTPIFGLPNDGAFANSLDFSLGNTVDSGEALFGVSAIFDGVQFDALLEIVSNHEEVSIMSRPKVAVREGARAEFENIDEVPYYTLGGLNPNGTFTATLMTKPVGVQMFVIPTIIGEETVLLNIDIRASQVSGTAISLSQGGDDAQGVISVPSISARRASTTVRLEPGEAVVLGGLIAERTLERERKVPLLGDIPVLGHLFKNKYEVTQQTNVLFYIRPRILQGMDLNSDF